MVKYKLVIMSPATEPNCVVKTHEDGAISAFPMSEDNRDYREYLEWVAEGNQPDPADA
jgi:hypothetical protein